GSGAAGLTAALAAAVAGAQVAVFEKADLIGGTTALSGGTIWFPNNQPARAAGIADSRERGLEYLASLSNRLILPDLPHALPAARGHQSVALLAEHTEIRPRAAPGYPDYPPEPPGGLARGGRSIEPALVCFAGLEEWSDRIAGDVRRTLIAESPLGGGTGVLPP